MNAPGSALCEAILPWAEATPRVRRLWLIGKSANAAKRSDSEVELAVEVEPVADSEESILVWLDNGERWRRELKKRIGSTVDLEWFDPDGSTPEVNKALREASVLVYDRAAVT
jgi:hypothetical protein